MPRLSRLHIQEFGRYLFAANGGRTLQSKRGKPKGTARQRNKAKHTKRRRTVARVVNKRRNALVGILALAMITQNVARSTRSLTRK